MKGVSDDRKFEIIPGPPHDDGQWRFTFTRGGVFAVHPEHPARFLEHGSDWWKVVRVTPDDVGQAG